MIEGLLYRATVNSWHGEAGDGKTTIALWAALTLIRAGLPVLWLDEEAGPDQIAEKLEAMGASAEELDERFHYYAYPAFSMDLADIAELHTIVAADSPAMVVWDSAPDAFAAAKVHEDSADEVTQWMRAVAAPLARNYDLALVLLDHVTKAAEGRNGYARGSGAKKAKMDGSFTVIKTSDFDRTRLGTIEMKRAKNRLGVLAPLVRFTVGGHDGDLVCERHQTAAEQPEELTPKDRAALKTLADRFYREGAQTHEWMEAASLSYGTLRRARIALERHGCITASGEGKSQRYAITTKGYATLGRAPIFTPELAFDPSSDLSIRMVDGSSQDSATHPRGDDTDLGCHDKEKQPTHPPVHDPSTTRPRTGLTNPSTRPPLKGGGRVDGSDDEKADADHLERITLQEMARNIRAGDWATQDDLAWMREAAQRHYGVQIPASATAEMVAALIVAATKGDNR